MEKALTPITNDRAREVARENARAIALPSWSIMIAHLNGDPALAVPQPNARKARKVTFESPEDTLG